MNQLKTRASREPVIEVLDKDNHPVQGAIISFTAPKAGPGASFANNNSALTVVTDAKGRAIAKGLQANAETGNYQIGVEAKYQDWHGTTAIKQSNVVRGPKSGGNAAVAAVAAGTGAASGASVAVLSSANMAVPAKSVINGITIMDAGAAPTSTAIKLKPADVIVTSAPSQ